MNGIGSKEMRPNGSSVNPGTIYGTEWAGLKLLPPTTSFAPIIIIIISIIIIIIIIIMSVFK
jgi:hypothetical protein